MGFLRGGRAVAGRPPRNDVGDIGRAAAKPDRRQHAVEQLAGAADEGQAFKILLAAGRLAHEHDGRLRIAVGKHQLLGGHFQRAALETLQDSSQFLEARRAFRRLARRHDGDLGRRRGGSRGRCGCRRFEGKAR